MRLPELLAPAGCWEALVAAVQNGADAVYLGGKVFNARRQAPNFGEEELKKAIAYAHAWGVKVYVTVNTLVTEEELEEAASFLRFLYEAGADAVIIQDPGLLRLARQTIPELELHASTQMTIHNSASARWLKEHGVKRVILARECTLEEIARIKAASDLEVEVFVHGALCFCYSGQCLFSSLVGGRSGNRGLCAQPCRLPYVLTDEKGRPLPVPEEVGPYLLSPRDLNLSSYLPSLVAAGVDGLKIEGRLKRPEYVAVVVRIYRQLLDRLGEGRFEVKPEEALALAQIFNRDFTPGYLWGRPGRDLMSYHRPNNRGVYLGRVLAYDRRSRRAQVKLAAPLRLGDGIEFWVSRGGRVGQTVTSLFRHGERVEAAAAGEVVELPVEERVSEGDRVFKTADVLLLSEARASYQRPPRPRVPLEFNFTARVGEPARLEARDDRGHEIVVFSQAKGEKATTQPLSWETVREKLGRLGNTPFFLSRLEGELEEGVFLPVSELNELRRRAVEEILSRRCSLPRPLEEKTFQERWRKSQEFPAKEARPPLPYLAVSCGDEEAVRAALAAGADRIYFGGEGFRFRGRPSVTPEAVAKVLRLVREAGASLFLLTPRITKDGEEKEVWAYLERGKEADGVVAGNLGWFYQLKSWGFKVWVDWYLHPFNRQALILWAEEGAEGVTLSPELNLQQVKKLAESAPLPLEVLVHGRLPVMVSEHCVVGSVLGGMGLKRPCSIPCLGRRFALRDRLGLLFPLYPDYNCRTHLFNSQELVMLAHLPQLLAAGVAGLRLEMRTAEAEEVYRVTAAYRRVLDACLSGKPVAAEEQEEALLGKKEFTRGHYFRGVV
ncbi:peptidase U32 [Ammonifex thiophilus]|uniref:Peptidase U32 n=1 Tax=Ammonifex thiophilus TaxID=444093 RepID=A0A3D8P3U1_9THEO|nr:peptidase U32 [Ammonifex thiophilus]